MSEKIPPNHPALQAPEMPLDNLAAQCFESASDDRLHPQLKAMNWRLWVLAGHLRVAVARQASLVAFLRQQPAPDKELARKVTDLDSQMAGFLKLFGPEIAEKLKTPAPAPEQAAPAAPAPTAPPATSQPATSQPAINQDKATAALIAAAEQGKREDMAGAHVVQTAKPKGKRS
jgi:hypothetical protein